MNKKNKWNKWNKKNKWNNKIKIQLIYNTFPIQLQYDFVYLRN
jgi:hypothetical protein